MRPLVSVVMPVRNEASFIAHSLGAVLRQDYPFGRMEVVVADGQSTDETREIVRSTAATSPVDVRIVDNPGLIASTGLNAAIAAARGEVIVRVDGHCTIAPDYIRQCVEALERTGADNVGGAQRATGDALVSRAVAAAFMSPFGSGAAGYRDPRREGWVDTVYLGAFKREVFDRIGGFDPEFVRTQDAELNQRLREAGGRIWLDPAIEVTYHGRASLRSLWRQYFQYGVYKVRFMQKRGGLSAVRQLVPPAFVVATTITLVAAVVTRRGWVGLTVAGPYLAANAAASAFAARRDPALAAVLPVVFAVIHIGWGLGFLAGLWRWRAVDRKASREP